MAERSNTHELEVRADVVVKRFRSWDRGEPGREWRALTLLAEYAPGLAPEPVSADLDSDPPVIVMSRLAGDPLRGTTVTADRLAALAEAINTLQCAVPEGVLEVLAACPWNPASAVAQVRAQMGAQCGQLGQSGHGPLATRALAATRRWLALARLDELAAAPAAPVFGLMDGNLANYLWDGSRVRMVDFEDSGPSDRAFELAQITEHPSTWVDGTFDVAAMVAQFDLDPEESARLRELRRLLAVQWLLNLLPGGPGHARNPPGTAERQAVRLLTLLD